METSQRSDSARRRAPRQERSKFMVEAILQATEKVLGERGFAQAGMRAIARTAGVSAGSLYQYFDGKESVVGTLIDQRLEADLEEVKAALGAVRNSPIEEAVQRGIELLVPEQEWKKDAMVAMADHMGDVHRSERLAKLLQQLAALLADYLRDHPQIRVNEPDASARTLVYALREAAFATMRAAPVHEPEKLRADLSHLALGYLERVAQPR